MNSMRLAKVVVHRSRCGLHTTSASRTKDYYKVLNVSEKASSREIKQAFYALSKLLHPDLSREHDAENKFKAIQEAYDILGDEDKRAKYDMLLRDGEYHPPETRSSSTFHRRDQWSSSSSSSSFKRQRPQYTGRTSRFDYDEHFRNHYGPQSDQYNNSSKWDGSAFRSGAFRASSGGGRTGGGGGSYNMNEDMKNYWRKKETEMHSDAAANKFDYEFRNQVVWRSLTVVIIFATIIFMFGSLKKHEDHVLQLNSRAHLRQQRVGGGGDAKS